MDRSIVEITSETFIKPSSPTTLSLRIHKLSYNEQTTCNDYVPLALFYPCGETTHDSESRSTTQISEKLQSSLSKTLAYYYPFAGRLTNNAFVDCNDEGVRYTEARIKCSMREILQPSNSHLKDLVFHRCLLNSPIPVDGNILVVQVSSFNCGGMAVSLGITHKIVDASTICSFISDWAIVTCQSGHVPTPQFNGALVFPPVDDPSILQKLITTSPPTANCISRRYLFKASKIAELKALAANSGAVDRPTRVEVVTALLYRCVMTALNSSKPSMLWNAANLRPITVPPLTRNSMGYLCTFFSISTRSAANDGDTTLTELVSKYRDAKLKLKYEYREKANGFNQFETKSDGIPSESFDVYSCSSWCRFPFYDVNFGFGTPSNVSTTNRPLESNFFLLMDTKDGDAVEAVVSLQESDMSLFQSNEELHAFASLIA